MGEYPGEGDQQPRHSGHGPGPAQRLPVVEHIFQKLEYNDAHIHVLGGEGHDSQDDFHLLKRESMAKGVKVYYNVDGTVSIELHIIVAA